MFYFKKEESAIKHLFVQQVADQHSLGILKYEIEPDKGVITVGQRYATVELPKSTICNSERMLYVKAVYVANT